MNYPLYKMKKKIFVVVIAGYGKMITVYYGLIVWLDLLTLLSGEF